VLVRRHRALDLNVTLVLGNDRALVVDTHAHAGYAAALVAAIRSVTALPWVVVLTHAHFDHSFGCATFAAAQPDVEIWSHQACRDELARGGRAPARVRGGLVPRGGPRGRRRRGPRRRARPANRTFTADAELDLGGRRVRLHHPGRGHTDHDVVIAVPDAGVTVVGDLVEEGAPPSFEDAYPLDWPETLTALLPGLRAVVVPGHGDVVDPGFVADQRDALAVVAEAARTLPPDADDRDLLRAAARLPVGRRAGLDALRRSRSLRLPRQV
jgi:glyoxylase-like metal-dependent hydrolase (beta-lactamase superfamily II)